MIIFFGPAGAGKSMQGQIVAARHGWRWLSTGQLLRDSHDPELYKQMQTGGLVSDEVMGRIVTQALSSAQDLGDIILDGYPRNLAQAEYLIGAEGAHPSRIEIAIVLDVPREELIRRLAIRGRADDTEELINRRLDIFEKETTPVLAYFEERGIQIARIVGNGTVGEIHDKIEAELVRRGIVEES